MELDVYSLDMYLKAIKRLEAEEQYMSSVVQTFPYKNAKGQKDTMKKLNKIISESLENEFFFDEERSPMSSIEVSKLIGGLNG
jgi:replicative superfamily II helicase